MGFLEAQIRWANGESIPVWNNMTTSNDDSPVGGRRGSNSGVIRQENERFGVGDGLNPNRIRGFGGSQPSGGHQRVETPSLNEMKARQGAIVANSKERVP